MSEQRGTEEQSRSELMDEITKWKVCAEEAGARLSTFEALRPQLVLFACQMEAKLRENDHKGGWAGEDSGWLLVRLCEEVQELREALNTGDRLRVIAEAADVANFAMMLADNARAAHDAIHAALAAVDAARGKR